MMYNIKKNIPRFVESDHPFIQLYPNKVLIIHNMLVVQWVGHIFLGFLFILCNPHILVLPYILTSLIKDRN